MKTQLQKETIQKKNLEEKLDKSEKANEEKRTLKRNLNEKEHEFSQQTKIITNLELAKKNLTKKG